VEALGIHEHLSKDKVFPRELLGLSRRQAGVLLGALWEGDGAAYAGTPRKTGSRPIRILFSSRSKSLASGVRHLLLQQGILSNITTSKVVKAPYYQVVVVGHESKVAFLRDELGGKISCPVSVRGGRTTRAGRELEGFSFLLQEQKRSRPVKRVVFPSHDYAGRGRTKNPRLEAGLRWVEVKSNLCIGRERCYNIEVPSYHAFLTGDCVVTHNSTGRLTKRHGEYFAISGQMLGYEHLARQKRPDLVGFKINLIQHAGSNTPKFERITLPRRPALERQFCDRVVDIERSIAQIQAEGRPVDEWPKAMSELVCFTRYGPCPHVDKCLRGPGAKAGGQWKWQG